MHKLVIATTLILAVAAGWIASTTHAQAPASAERVNPSQIAVNATNLPTEEFADYSFVFN